MVSTIISVTKGTLMIRKDRGYLLLTIAFQKNVSKTINFHYLNRTITHFKLAICEFDVTTHVWNLQYFTQSLGHKLRFYRFFDKYRLHETTFNIIKSTRAVAVWKFHQFTQSVSTQFISTLIFHIYQ